MTEHPFDQIEISETKTTPGQLAEAVATRSTLATKLKEYIFRLGQTHTQTLGICVQILTVGKVRIEFRDYTERVSLTKKTDLMSRPQAILASESFMASLIDDQGPVDLDVTQKIIIQSPKRTVL
jgi:hypothetical protein